MNQLHYHFFSCVEIYSKQVFSEPELFLISSSGHKKFSLEYFRLKNQTKEKILAELKVFFPDLQEIEDSNRLINVTFNRKKHQIIENRIL